MMNRDLPACVFRVLLFLLFFVVAGIAFSHRFDLDALIRGGVANFIAFYTSYKDDMNIIATILAFVLALVIAVGSSRGMHRLWGVITEQTSAIIDIILFREIRSVQRYRRELANRLERDKFLNRPLESIYVPNHLTVYTGELHYTQSRGVHFYADQVAAEQMIEQGKRQEVYLLEEVIKRRKKSEIVVVCGSDGSGKSALLQYYALKVSVSSMERSMIPILLSSDKTYLDLDIGLIEWLKSNIQMQYVGVVVSSRCLRNRMRSGKCIIIIDDLDRIYDNGGGGCINKFLQEIINKFPAVVVIVSVGFRFNMRHMSSFMVSSYELSGLDLEKTEGVIRKYFERDIRRSKRLIGMIEVNSNLRSISNNPRSLVKMMQRYEQSESMAADPFALYASVVDEM
jgi:energy-coupling factor transporter ATP-binding protein EcfA2